MLQHSFKIKISKSIFFLKLTLIQVQIHYLQSVFNFLNDYNDFFQNSSPPYGKWDLPNNFSPLSSALYISFFYFVRFKGYSLHGLYPRYRITLSEWNKIQIRSSVPRPSKPIVGTDLQSNYFQPEKDFPASNVIGGFPPPFSEMPNLKF